jgi:hypothetical protein
MGFKSLLEKQVGSVFDILGQVDGLAPNQTFVESGGQTYNTTARTYTTSTTQHADIPMVLARFSVEEIDAEVVVTTDLKALIPAIKMPVSPSIGDKIITAAGETYAVQRSLGVPGDSLYILHVRRES